MSATPAGTRKRLPRRLGLFGAITIVVGITIGSGIFRSPAGIANQLPGPGTPCSRLGRRRALALCGALTLAEVASALPETGGIYVFMREGWGRLPAFLFGWAELVIIRAAALGAIATTFAEYFLRVLGYDPLVAPYDDVRALHRGAARSSLTAAFNIVGIRWSSLVTRTLTTLAKYGGLLFIIMLAFVIGLPKTRRPLHAGLPAGKLLGRAVRARAGLGAVGVRRLGRPHVRRRRGEGPRAQSAARDHPRHRSPCSCIYLLANLAYLSVLPVEEIRHVEARRGGRRVSA